MTVCGRCRGRTVVKPTIGFGDKVCPDCHGTGIKTPKSSLGKKTVSVPVNGAACKVCGEPAVQSHHVVSQSRLTRFLSPEEAQRAKADVRNTVPLCWDCHERVEAARLDLAWHELHPDFPKFIAEHNLEAALPRQLTGLASTKSERTI